jgi:hypothetical protein
MMDSITHISLREWETQHPERGTPLAGVSLGGAESARSLAERFAHDSVLDVTELRTGLRIKTFSHVGRIALGNLDITIFPKIDLATLLQLLRYAYGLRNHRLFLESEHRMEHAGFEDLLVSQLNAEVIELIARGLHRTYVLRHNMLASPRGRIDLERLARHGGVLDAVLPCMHHPRVEDSLLNQTLLAGLRNTYGLGVWNISRKTGPPLEFDLQLRFKRASISRCASTAVNAAAGHLTSMRKPTKSHAGPVPPNGMLRSAQRVSVQMNLRSV